MRELDKSKVYDLSELNEEQLYKIHEWLKERDNGWVNQVPHTDLFFHEIDGWLYNKSEKVNDMTNAKELFYTLENIKVDCTELYEEHIENMKEVVLSLGYSLWDDDNAFIVEDLDKFFNKNESDNDFLIGRGGFGKITITYDKFMELFGENKVEMKINVKDDLSNSVTEAFESLITVIKEKPKHYSQGIDTFARMEANCTKEECLAFAKGNIDKYNWRNKDQDVEDLKKIIQYANWALKVHAEK